MKLRLSILWVAALCAAVGQPRLVVLTDIGGDPDDQQSMVRLMTYSNEFDIEGLIASAAGTPGELKKNIVRPELIREIVDAYAKARPNLARHARGYPLPAALGNVVKSGNPNRGEANVGEGHDTEGSRWLISVVDRKDPRPVNVTVWGGPTELAQALWRVRKDRSAAELKRFIAKLRVYAVGHQDDSGPWIVQNFPDLFYLLAAADPNDVSGRPQKGRDRRGAVIRGMYLGGDESLTSREWIDTHVRANHGPLGALYPPKTWTAPNPHSALKEGDTPSWFYFLPRGVNDPEQPEWGGWGGRFRRLSGNLFNDAPDTVDNVTDARAGVWRWRPAFQNEFEARMDWCVTADPRGANHEPVAVLNGDRTRRIVTVRPRVGEQVRMSAAGSSDPDGGKLTYRWFVYPEATGFGGTVELNGASGQIATFQAPERSVHVVLEVRDGGKPELYAHRRAVIAPR